MNIETESSSTIAAFSRLPWHDSEFLGWRVAYNRSDEPVVTFDIVFRASGMIAASAEVQFHDVRGIYADVDLLAKQLAGDQIASGRCEDAEVSRAEFAQRLAEKFDLYPGESVNGLVLFTVQLIPPAGEVLVLARSFSVTQQSGA